MPSNDELKWASVDAGMRPKNLRPKAWDSDKPPGGKLPEEVEHPQNHQPQQPSNQINSPTEKDG